MNPNNSHKANKSIGYIFNNKRPRKQCWSSRIGLKSNGPHLNDDELAVRAKKYKKLIVSNDTLLVSNFGTRGRTASTAGILLT